MEFKIIEDNYLIIMIKNSNESMDQFFKKIECYIKAKKEKINDDNIIMLSTAYLNKIKYKVQYNYKLESLLSTIFTV